MSKSVKVEDILGRMEIRELIGATETQMDYWVYRDANFPKPFLTLKGSRLWERQDVEAWMAHRGFVEVIKPVEPPSEPGKPRVPVVKPVNMTEDERAAVLNRIFG